MIPAWLVLVAAFGYLMALFWVAHRVERGPSRWVSNPYVYSLAIAVYCTSWTFYGSVGAAASTGVGFLPIYLGPTLTFTLGLVVLRKIVRIGKAYGVTSIADFISSRYGKSQLLGGVVTVIAVIGIMPYISLQLKAVSATFSVIAGDAGAPVGDTALYVAVALGAFTILFGVRRIEAAEHHKGMVAAVAVESIVKLAAILGVGAFVAFGLFDGFGDLFARAAVVPDVARLMRFEAAETNWVAMTILAMLAVICLPRQFHVVVVENNDERHLDKAMWLFPLYLFAINLFVLPIAVGGLLHFPHGHVDPDSYVLALPLAEGRPGLALLAFLGGLSAATAMVIVAATALATMVGNDLAMPAMMRLFPERLAREENPQRLLLGIRRGAVVGILALGYAYYRLIGESHALVTMGLMSFAAAAQFAPAMIGGVFWKGATRRGALAGLVCGFLVWGVTLLLPSFARSGWLPGDVIANGLFGLELLRPYALFGVEGLDPVSHALFWTMVANIGAYVVVSLLDRPSMIERNQATLFVEINDRPEDPAEGWRAQVRVVDLRRLSGRFLGAERADQAFALHAHSRDIDLDERRHADVETIRFVERLLARAVGAASARVMVANAVQGGDVGYERAEIMEVLDETSQVLEYSRRLEHKSQELERTSKELRAANERLQELDRMKDEFLSTVAHELRTPLTSIQSFSEILQESPEIDEAERRRFLSIIASESGRLTRLTNRVLDLAKIEQGSMDWRMSNVDVRDVLEDALATMAEAFRRRGVRATLDIQPNIPPVWGDRDRLMQVAINLLSNAEKYCPDDGGHVEIVAEADRYVARVTVRDNGPGVPVGEREAIFLKFHQIMMDGDTSPTGSGLGLAISRLIVEHLGGRIYVNDAPGGGAAFHFTMPIAVADSGL